MIYLIVVLIAIPIYLFWYNLRRVAAMSDAAIREALTQIGLDEEER